ncbi:MAG: polysaccharide biosynthesis/export family protein, partial [Mycobacterium sp.]
MLRLALPVAAAILLVVAGSPARSWAQAATAQQSQSQRPISPPPESQLPATPPAQSQHLASQPPATQPPAVADPGYKLGSGDHVRITVFGQQDLTGEYAVDGSGMLAFPLIGQVQAGGLTANGLERLLASKLSPNYLKNPSIGVEVLTYRPFYIVGEVKTPGSYQYVAGMTVLNAVALAGGFTYRAREDSFYVTKTQPDGSKVRVSALV